jgi:hypothetical protein
MTNPTDTFHTAPLRWLARTKLHAGRSLADNVRRLRWRRRRAPVATPPTTEAQPLTQQAQHDTSPATP